MARMFPDQPSEATQSNAERKVFARIRDETPETWTALHSLGLKGHSRKMWAEADFVLISPLGVYVIEVKGGAIGRRGRTWVQNGKEMRESPFDQGGGAAGALRADLREHVAKARGACVAHGVAFPDVVFSVDGPDVERELVYDADDQSEPFQRYIERLAVYWERNMGRSFRALSPADQGAIAHRLAGDFDLVPSLRSQVSATELELFRLTEQQKAAVAGLAEEPRVVVLGAAGTGKTLLAIAEAERLAEAGKRVLLCCLTPRLADLLSAAVADHPEVIAVEYHSWLRCMIDNAGRADELPDAQAKDLLDVFYPAVAIDAFEGAAMSKFDAIVVDEAQDLMLSTHLELFDAVIGGGLNGGCWRFFLDPFQDVHGGAGDDARAIVEENGQPFRLLVNCRNTAPIAIAATLLAGRTLNTILSPEGPSVEHHWYDSRRDLRKLLARQVSGWLERGISPREIVVLSPKPRAESAVAEGLPDGVPATIWDRDSGKPRPDNGVEFATVDAFKGAEATAVVVTDIDDLATARSRTVIYVAASRATTLLSLCLHHGVGPAYQQAARAFGGRVAAAG